MTQDSFISFVCGTEAFQFPEVPPVVFGPVVWAVEVLVSKFLFEYVLCSVFLTRSSGSLKESLVYTEIFVPLGIDLCAE